MALELSDVKRIAHLARIEVSEGEAARRARLGSRTTSAPGLALTTAHQFGASEHARLMEMQGAAHSDRLRG